jgi:hypothetical protein
VIHEIEAGARLVMIGAGVIVLYAASLYKYPFRPCAWCKGTGRNRGSNARRYGHCWRCRGTGRVQRLGSRTVHRLAWAIRGEMSQARARRAAKRAAERSMHPRDLADRDN